MNILVVGNGFDLAHGLPTRYIDFWNFLFVTYSYYNKKEKGVNIENIETLINGKNISSDLMEILQPYVFEEQVFTEEQVYKLLCDNYIINRTNKVNDRWIDFEKELSNIVADLFNNKEHAAFSSFLKNKKLGMSESKSWEFNKDTVEESLLGYLNELILSFERK